MAGTLLNNTINQTDANQQLASTINQGGLLMRMAKSQGAQQAGSRGLMNSSIGNEASQRAIVAAAQPLALQNTQFAQSRDLNLQQSDLTLQRDAKQQEYNKENMGLQFGYSTKLNDQQNAFTASQSALDRQQQMTLQNDAQDFTASQSAMDRSQQITMENLQQKNRLGLLDAQGKQDLAKLEAQFQNQSKLNTQQNQFTAGQSALDRQQQVTLENLQQKNRLGLLDAQGKKELAQMEAQFQNQTKLNTQQNQFTAGQSALDRQQQLNMQRSDQGFNASQNALNRTQQTNLQNDAQLFNSEQAKLDRAQQLTMQNDAQSFASGQSALDRAQQTNLTNLQFKNQTALNTQQNQATTARDATLFGYDQKNKATDFANQLKTMSEQQRLDLQKLNAQTAATKDINAQQQQYVLTNTAKQVAANTQGMYLEAINGLTSTFGDQVAAIQASAMNAGDKKTAINSLINSQNAMLKFYQSTYQNMSTIKDDWINVDVKTLPSGTIANVK